MSRRQFDAPTQFTPRFLEIVFPVEKMDAKRAVNFAQVVVEGERAEQQLPHAAKSLFPIHEATRRLRHEHAGELGHRFGAGGHEVAGLLEIDPGHFEARPRGFAALRSIGAELASLGDELRDFLGQLRAGPERG